MVLVVQPTAQGHYLMTNDLTQHRWRAAVHQHALDCSQPQGHLTATRYTDVKGKAAGAARHHRRDVGSLLIHECDHLTDETF